MSLLIALGLFMAAYVVSGAIFIVTLKATQQ